MFFVEDAIAFPTRRVKSCNFHARPKPLNAFIRAYLMRKVLSPRGWAQTNFVELWSVSRPRLAEMAIEIWVMCQLTEKLFETSLVRWNLQVRIFVRILGDTSISGHLWEWKRKETCIESKEVWHFEYLAVFPESSSWIIVESKIVHSLKNSSHSWSQLSSDNGKICSRSRLYQPEAFGPPWTEYQE